MLEKLKEINDIEITDIFDPAFLSYGRILDMDVDEIIKTAEQFAMPENVIYMPSTPEFEVLSVAKTIKKEVYGTLPTQIGFCYGHSSMLNATEWHTSSEVNIAATDLVLILGHLWDIRDDKIDSSAFKGFFVPRGAAIEVFATTLHYCPCQVSDEGFRCIVGLPAGTNTALETAVADKRITAKNKWLITHVDNEAKIRQGAVAGITGVNYKIQY